MRTVLVTGASRNIGLAIAGHFVELGWRVGLNGRDADAVHAAVESLGPAAPALALPGDVTDPAAVEGMVRRLTDEWGGVDAVVNNAGQRAHGPVDSLTQEHWDAVLATVLTGAFLTTRAALPGMRDRGWGRIVNIAGMSGQSGAAGRVAVVTAKAGLIGFTKAIAHEAGADGVTVNAISPGHIETERRPGLGDDAVARSHYATLGEVGNPVGRLGRPDEVAALAGYLCGDQAAYLTGQVLGLNGGAHM